MAPVTIARFVQELEKLKQVSDAEKLKPQEYDSRLARIIQELREKGIDADRAATTAAPAAAGRRWLRRARRGGPLAAPAFSHGTTRHGGAGGRCPLAGEPSSAWESPPRSCQVHPNPHCVLGSCAAPGAPIRCARGGRCLSQLYPSRRPVSWDF